MLRIGPKNTMKKWVNMLFLTVHPGWMRFYGGFSIKSLGLSYVLSYWVKTCGAWSEHNID